MPSVDGLSQAILNLKRQVERQAVPDSLDDAAADIVADAKDAAPVESGALRESLTFERAGLEVRIGPDSSAVNAEGVPAEEYGELVELDQPYLRPAIDAAGPRVQRALREKLSQI